MPSHCWKRLDPLMVPQNPCTVLRVAVILHCVSFSYQQKHVCFCWYEHFVQSPEPNTSTFSDFRIVSLMTRFILCCCWILVTLEKSLTVFFLQHHIFSNVVYITTWRFSNMIKIYWNLMVVRDVYLLHL